MSQQTAPVEALVERILQGDAPLALRSAASRGALPLPPASLTRLYVHLIQDPEAQVRAQAEASLKALGKEEILEVLSDPGCPPEVMIHFAPKAARDESMAEVMAFHGAMPNEALTVLAAEGNASVINLVLTNQEKLLSCPGLLDKLTTNPALRTEQRGRILDLLDRFFGSKEGDEAGSAAAVAQPGEVMAEAEAAARVLNVDVGELFSASEIMGGEELEQAEDPLIRSAYSGIVRLTTAQKAMLALKGGREERMILVRDTNKVVALAVLKNPKLTDQEVEGIAMMRNVTDEVLRILGTNREWIRSYTVVSALVHNPRTPTGISTNFIPRLMNADLKTLTRDKNVPELVRRMAKRTFDLRTQKTAPTFKRK